MNNKEELGRVYGDGEIIFRRGEKADCMYVIQTGKVEVILEDANKEVRLTILEEGDIFGEMALFTHEPRSATVRAFDRAHVVTVDKIGFLKRIHQDPSLVFNILQKMSHRISDLSREVVELRKKYGAFD